MQLCSDTDNDSDDELAATPKAVKAVMDETKTKAPLDSPAFTGTPTTPTPPDDAAGLEAANAAFVRKLLAALVGSSPEVLDTLNRLRPRRWAMTRTLRRQSQTRWQANNRLMTS